MYRKSLNSSYLCTSVACFPEKFIFLIATTSSVLQFLACVGEGGTEIFALFQPGADTIEAGVWHGKHMYSFTRNTFGLS